MSKDVKYTFKHTAIYGVSNLLVKLAGLILLPIYTTQFTTDEFGVVVILEVIAQFFVGVVSLNLPAAILRIGSDEDNKNRIAQVYSTGMIGMIVSGILFLLITLPFATSYSKLLFNSASETRIVTLLVLSIVIEILSLGPLSLIRLRQKPLRYIAIFAIKLISLVVFSWWFIAEKSMGIEGYIWASLTANGVVAILGILAEITHITYRFNRAIWKEMIQYGAPLILTTVAGLLLTLSDRIIIKLFGVYSDVGIYGLAYKLGSVSNLLIIGTFALGFLPIAFKKVNDPDFKAFFSKMFTYFIGAIISLTLVISLFSQEIIKLISKNQPDYWVAIILVPIIGLAFIFKGLQTYFGYTFYLTKKTRKQASVNFYGVVFNILLNFLLIPAFGLYGAIAATGFSYLFMSIYSYRLAVREMKVIYEFNRLAILFILSIMVVLFGIAISDFSLQIRLLAKISMVILYLLIILFGVIRKKERMEIFQLINEGLSLLKK